MRSLFLFLTTMLLIVHHASAQDTTFSGPQPNEKLPTFKVRGILDELAGKELDFVELADGKPLLLIFIHDVNRQSIGFVRTLTRYSMSLTKDGLSTGVVMLADDASAAEATVKRMQHALTRQAPIGVSLDGNEGPGAYGLNRTMTLTILVAHENRVIKNFALVQPSIQADLANVVEALCQVVGCPTPSLPELLSEEPGMLEMISQEASARSSEQPEIRSLIRPLIKLDANQEQVDRAAQVIIEAMKKYPEIRKEVHRIATTIVDSGKLDNYGTETARKYLKQWATDAKEEKGEPPSEPKLAPSKKVDSRKDGAG